MQTENFKSNRHFTIKDFLISHGQLLIRSSKSEAHNTNIDIILFDVHYIQMPTSFNGISIKALPHQKDIIKYHSISTLLEYKDNFIFEIETNMEKYYVVASYFKVFENDLEFHETSLGVLESIGREKEITKQKN